MFQVIPFLEIIAKQLFTYCVILNIKKVSPSNYGYCNHKYDKIIAISMVAIVMQ